MNTTSRTNSIALASLVGLFQIPSATAAPGDTALVVRSPSSSTATELSLRQSISIDGRTQSNLSLLVSGNGRYVVFRSTAPNLVATDRNLSEDIFLFDRTTDTTSRIANPRTCTKARSPSYLLTDAAVSSTGRYVLWAVEEPCGDIELETTSLGRFDRQTNTRKVSSDSGFARRYRTVRFSGDENLIVFDREDNVYGQIWLDDIVSGQIKQISGAVGADPIGDSHSPSINADGSVIAYASEAGNLVPNDTNGVADVFVYRSATGQSV